MFRNWLGGSRDMFLASSADGQRFAPAVKLGEGTWPLNACPMDGGALAVGRDGTVETVWRRGSEVFACRPGERERKLGAGTQPWIAAVTGPAVWLQDGSLRMGKAGGAVGSLPSGNDPVVADVEGAPLVVWSDAAGGVWAQGP